MTVDESSTAVGSTEEVSALIATLHQTSQRLEFLTAGQVDSVTDRDGRTFVLRHAQEQLRHSEADRQAGILNALPAHIALLDPQGYIVSVNESWRRFAGANALQPPGDGVGLDYLAVCDNATGDNSSEAHQAAAGIRSVLEGGAREYSLEYPCHSPSVQRWFLMAVTPLAQGRATGAVVMHLDITGHKLAEQALQASRQRLDGLVASAMDGIVTVSEDQRIVLFNPAAEKMFGYAAGALIGQPLSLLIPERHRLQHPAHVTAFGETGFTARVLGALRPISGLRQNGEEFPMEASISRDSSTGQRFYTAILRDVTERKRVEDAQKQSDARYRTLFDYAPDGIVIADPNGHYLDANASSCRMLGYTRAEFIGLHSSDVVAPAERPEIAAALHALQTTTDYHREWQLRRKDGSTFPAEVIGTAMPDGNLLAMIRDITERKLAEAALHKVQRDLVDSSRRAGMAEVATSVLHNVGNVLTSVNVSASVVMDNARNSRADSMARVATLLVEHMADLGTFITTDPKGRHIPAFLQQISRDWLAQQKVLIKELESLRANIDHIKSIVAMQQTYAKVSGTSEMVSLTQLVEDSLRMEQDALHRHQVEIVRDFQQVPPINSEKHKILQILVNLVRNARYACAERGGASRVITLRVAAAGDHIRLVVGDNGVGIAPDNLTRIFSHGYTTRKQGHGFGLHGSAIAATELGGSLRVHSDGPGKGAVFTLELPLARAEPSHG